jgi:hypothetical protein
MAIFDLFSKRQKRIRGEVPEVYQYVDLSDALRVQIVHIIKDAIGKDKDVYGYVDRANLAYKFLHEALCREYGLFVLIDNYSSHQENVLNFFLKTEDYEKAIDIIELAFRYVHLIIREGFQQYTRNTQVELTPDQAIEELNERFKEQGVGYQFEGGEIIRVDSTYAHAEIVKPTLSLLWNNKFSGANDEYLKAHEHYRHGRNKECLADCLKAFESTMKIICKEKGWAFNENDTSRKLIQICFQNNLVPPFTQNQFTSLQNLLESGVPTIRNRLGGHGQGQVPQKVDDEMTRYALNLTGSNIIFLVEQSGIK